MSRRPSILNQMAKTWDANPDCSALIVSNKVWAEFVKVAQEPYFYRGVPVLQILLPTMRCPLPINAVYTRRQDD